MQQYYLRPCFLCKLKATLKVLYNLKMGCQVSTNCLQSPNRKYKFSARLLHFSENALNNPESPNKSLKAERSDFESRLNMSILSYQQFLEANPHLRYPFDGLGNVEDQVGCLEGRVESWYQEWRETGLLSGNPFDALSLCYSLKKDVSEGRKWYQEMLAKHPANEYLHFGLGNLHYKAQDYEECEKCYRKAIDINPRLDKAYQNISNIYCFRKIDNAQAEEWSKFALKINTKNQYALLINAIVHENVSYRIQLLEKLMETHPNYARIHNALGLAYMEKEKNKAAIKVFLEGYTKNPLYYAIPCGLALAHSKIKKYDEAITWSNKSIQLNPVHHEPYHTLGDAFRGKGAMGEAKKWYLKCIEINPQFDEAYLKLARLILSEDEAQAIRYFEIYLERNPQNSQVLYELAQLYRKKKQAHVSVNLLLSMPNLQSQKEALFLLGELMEELASTDEAQCYFSLFIKNSEDKAEAIRRVEKKYKQLGQSDRIAVIIQKMLRQQSQ